MPLNDDDSRAATAAIPEPTARVPRRGLLRGGAVLLGAAGAAALAATPAHAADGDNLTLGSDNTASSTTALTIGGDAGTDAAALSLANAGGPALRLEPLPDGWSGQLEIGDLAGSSLGPLVGVDTLDGTTTSYLVTGVDLGNVPTPFPSEPKRVLDLRTAAGRDSIIRRSSPTALTSDGKLRAGQWIDIGIAFTASDYVLTAIFANLTAVRPVSGGYATLYSPGVRPTTSSINFRTVETIANAAFIGTGSVLSYHAVRLYTSAESWFLLDVTGGVSSGSVAAPLGEAKRAATARTSLNRRVTRAIGKLKR